MTMQAVRAYIAFYIAAFITLTIFGAFLLGLLLLAFEYVLVMQMITAFYICAIIRGQWHEVIPAILTFIYQQVLETILETIDVILPSK